MADRTSDRFPGFFKVLKPAADILIPLIAWTCFTIGFVFFFASFQIVSALFYRDRKYTFQRLNHHFFQWFFRLLGVITPGLSYRIPEEVRAIRGSVIVSNHLSYLDPILFISLYPLQKTIVKRTFFRVPILGWVMRRSGYLPSATEGRLDLLMIRQMENLPEYLASGGNLFVFPEGTRSRDGRIGQFNKGAFKIARRCDAPIQVLRIRNTERLFPPGGFRFNTCVANTISVERVGAVGSSGGAASGKASNLGKASTSELMDRVRGMLDG